MEHRVEEREQSQHPAQPDDRIPAGEAADRRHRQRDHQQRQRPRAGLIGDVVAGIGGEVVGVEAVDERRGGDERRGEDERLAGRRSASIILAQIHAAVETRDLIGVAVEHLRLGVPEQAGQPRFASPGSSADDRPVGFTLA